MDVVIVMTSIIKPIMTQQTYTDTQLKQTLAKLLLNELTWEFQILFWKNKQADVMMRDPSVLDTELLHLCWLVEDALTPIQKIQFADNLYQSTTKSLLDYSGVYYPGESPELDLDLLFSLNHATWQQRITALAEVFNIKIV